MWRLVALMWLACRCGGGPPVGQAHFEGFDGVISAVALSDAAGAADAARALRNEEAAQGAALGGALGMLQVAEREELVDGLMAAAEACGACHQAERVRPLGGKPPGDHQRGAAHVMFGVIFPGEGLDWQAGAPAEVRAATDARAVLLACEGCHGGPEAGLERDQGGRPEGAE